MCACVCAHAWPRPQYHFPRLPRLPPPPLQALEALKPHLATVHSSYADVAARDAGGRACLSLIAFERMADDAGLLRRPRMLPLPPRGGGGGGGGAAPRDGDVCVAVEHVQHAFHSALPILRADRPGAALAALAAGPEFHEAILRLTREYVAAGKKPARTPPVPPTPGALFAPTEEGELLEALPVVCSRLSAYAC